MKYSLRVTATFERSFRTLDVSSRRRVDTAVVKLEDDPRAGKPLKGQLSGRWSLRVGDIRVIYLIDDSVKSVTLLDVGKRRSVYD